MLKDVQISQRAFRPHEVEAFTGLSVAMQRVWRHRELLRSASTGKPPTTGHRSGDGLGPLDLAHILILLSLNGFAAQDLKIASEHASLCSRTVLWYAARYPEAWSFEGPPVHVAEMQEDIARFDVSNLDGRIRDFALIPREQIKRYSVRLAEGVAWTDDLGTLFSEASELGGVIIDHESMAKFLLKAVRGSLFFAVSTRAQEDGQRTGLVGERTITKSAAGRHAARRLAYAMGARQTDKDKS